MSSSKKTRDSALPSILAMRCRHAVAGCAVLIMLMAVTDRSAAPASTVSLPSEPLSHEPSSAPATVQIPIDAVAVAIRAGIERGSDAAHLSLTKVERQELVALYRAESHAPLWLDAEGRPSRSAREALTLLRDAAREGLDPAEYRSSDLDALAATLEAAQSPRVPDLAGFDLGLSTGTLRYLRHVHLGRVDPRSIGFRMTTPADVHDFAALVHAAITEGGIGEVAADLTPRFALYRGLRTMLGRYRSLAREVTFERLPPVTALRPGEPYAGLDALHRRLVALGDLAPDTPPPAESARYERALVDGVKRFQIRHGLEANGIFARDTQAALDVPVGRRVRQIELALERLRWLPHLREDRLVAVNIPMFRLWAWDSVAPNRAPSFSMDVIVGRALNTQTPVFVEEMQYLVFRPYWNVPPGILRSEVLPALERDPDYLRQRDMEMVSGYGDDARPLAVTPENLALLRRGLLRVRQRPGPNNAMGLVKFMFPNDAHVYMHDTPAEELFSRTRRDFSRGCIRVENPAALAEWALNDQPQWTRARIVAAMNARQPRRVNLARPIQVILFYITAAVMPEDGTIHFAEDIYGHDVRLDRALALRRPTP